MPGTVPRQVDRASGDSDARYTRRQPMFGIRNRLLRRSLDAEGRADVKRLLADHPAFVPNDRAWSEIDAELRPAYDDYVMSVSPAYMAASLETSIYLFHLCQATRATSVLDLGSGFSSYVFRRYAQEAGESVTVTSVDTEEQWLLHTSAFLDKHRCAADGLVTWADYQSAPTGPHDVVFHDLASGDVREAAMSFATKQVSDRGAIVYDDAHHQGHRDRMFAEGTGAGLKLYSLRTRTLDSFQRWSVMGST